MKILCVCLSATIQRTVSFRDLNMGFINRSEHYRMDASGKAVNAARVLEQLEHDTSITLCTLGRENAEAFLSLARRDGLDVRHVETPGRTRECWTLLDRTHGTTTEIIAEEEDERDAEFPESEAALLGVLEKVLPQCDAVILAGSRRGVWSAGLMAYIARMVCDAGKFLLADYHGEDLERTLAVCTPQVIKINKDEFCESFDLSSFVTDGILTEAIAAKSRALGNIIIVTQGARNTVAAMKGESALFPTEKVRAVNTMGAGDSFSAGFLHEYLTTDDFHGALARGTWCAARNIEREAPGSVVDE